MTPMAVEYQDLYVRDNFGDDGTVPSPGSPYESPDIIPLQSGILTYAEAQTSYTGPDLGEPIVSGAANNVFVRAMNLGATPSSGQVSLFYSPGNLFLVPNLWTRMQTASGDTSVPLLDGSGSGQIGARTVAIGQSAFLLTNLPDPSGRTHYCMISVIQTPAHPVTVPASFASNADMVNWIQTNPGVGWRNIVLLVNPGQQLAVIHGFSNLTAGYWIFSCVGQNFVPGSTITLTCTDTRCPFQQTGVLPAPDAQGNQNAVFQQMIPVIDQSAVTVTVDSQTRFAKTVQMQVTAYQIPNPEIELEMQVARTVRLGGLLGASEAIGGTTLIKLGEMTTLLTTD